MTTGELDDRRGHLGAVATLAGVTGADAHVAMGVGASQFVHAAFDREGEVGPNRRVTICLVDDRGNTFRIRWVEPTNKLAEQAKRFVVIDRRITQGTRSKRRQRWCKRIWTAIATCPQQGRSVFEYLREAVNAHFHGQPIPSLIPARP